MNKQLRLNRGEKALMDSVNLVKISKKALMQLHTELNALPKRLRNGDAIPFVAARLSKNNAQRAMALTVRMFALVDAVKNAHLKGWTIPNRRDGWTAVEESVIAAAAVEPVACRKSDGGFAFDYESFRARVLAFADTTTQS